MDLTKMFTFDFDPFWALCYTFPPLQMPRNAESGERKKALTHDELVQNCSFIIEGFSETIDLRFGFFSLARQN